MPVSTISAAAHITPVVVKTFLEHRKKRKEREKDGHEAPQDDILFDEAFHIVKAFIELGTKNTIESLQAFTNTHIPSPFWAVTSPVCIPLTTCNEAADVLIEWFGPEELKHVVGGERWWQVRGLDGVDGEWIAERDHLDEDEDVSGGRKLEKEEEDILRMEQLESVLLYVHGGGYFWGSINTHRFQILRYARKLRGRAFAVNYRKAPQYPWPCPLQDVLAAYLYLIQPPPGSLHKAVPPNKIVLAGDSAGGGLCLSTLTILRDMGLPMPAGVVLISPWVDLTHSFPSVMQNTETDIIPPHGFLAKPSVLWPIDPMPQGGSRLVPTETNPPPKPGHADVLKPTKSRVEIAEEAMDVPVEGHPVGTQEQMFQKYSEIPTKEDDEEPSNAAWNFPSSSAQSSLDPEKRISVDEDIDLEHWEPKPPKILMENNDAVPMELRSQIQMYATTEQLTHPLVSPILQGSLGNLPPLYILAGDGEVLRDEAIYLAHRAAHPSEYPVRKGILRGGRRQMENAQKFTTPTKVHFQVFDGMCHVLTVFMFTEGARYAYRSIAEFVKHVTQSDPMHIALNPFPEFHWPPDLPKNDSNDIVAKAKAPKNLNLQWWKSQKKGGPDLDAPSQNEEKDPIDLFHYNQGAALRAVEAQQVETLLDNLGSEVQKSGISEGQAKDIPNVLMLRERVDIHGQVRLMEPKEQIAALQIPPCQIGIIKEAPAVRWQRGQEQWDRRYRQKAVRVLKKREKLKIKTDRLVRHALHQGLVHEAFPESLSSATNAETESRKPIKRKTSIGKIQKDRRWGPLDLQDERPPASAIAGRRDTAESLALLRRSIYHTAPVTHQTVPRLKTSDTIRATFDPHDNPNAAPNQSASEQQVKAAPVIPMHGLRIWDNILGYLGRKSAAKASDAAAHFHHAS